MGRYAIVITPERWRVAFYSSFILLFGLCVGLTKRYVHIDDTDNPIYHVFGYTNVCINFDFPPSSYVAPGIWPFVMMCGVIYQATCMLRNWTAWKDGKLSSCEYYVLACMHVYVILSFFAFSICFAVGPTENIVLHTLPFTAFMLALFFVAVANWYYINNVPPYLPMWKQVAGHAYIGVFSLATLAFMFLSVYLLYVDHSEMTRRVIVIVDDFWECCAIIVPPFIACISEQWTEQIHIEWKLLPTRMGDDHEPLDNEEPAKELATL
uniref:Uncharacterized protein n=1 Tax=Chromera velia CCMP2878 TaxID=1169474 RepID=A0A0G4GFG6_9ALVE|eukprot:Cvel_21573.t1-p1 / transcript=Cvel_21573.t1 / gene=Cvel_21573 / organism=Chromera_velia_CCMP2878 / gene_product=hypothetical protein / transcript_product=hypothetical protein / location=Cvel_scaffold2035:18997-20883(+) / protein_length=265 / sequence_SO=supercontig / SO=protein_coding / is_pseudo=false